LGISCPDNFTNFIDKCISIPANLPAPVTYSVAAAACTSLGQQMLTVGSLYLQEGIRSYLNNTNATSSLWIGRVAGLKHVTDLSL
jgi:hypothetical protein